MEFDKIFEKANVTSEEKGFLSELLKVTKKSFFVDEWNKKIFEMPKSKNILTELQFRQEQEEESEKRKEKEVEIYGEKRIIREKTNREKELLDFESYQPNNKATRIWIHCCED